jgi:hypothetical protein
VGRLHRPHVLDASGEEWGSNSRNSAEKPSPGRRRSIATANPGYVDDLIAVDTGRGTVEGDIGALQTVSSCEATHIWPVASSSV